MRSQVDSRIILSAILLLLAACGRSPVLTPEAALTVAASATPVHDPLADSKWFLSSLYGEPVLAGTRITLEFYDGFIRGVAGCNQYDRLVRG